MMAREISRRELMAKGGAVAAGFAAPRWMVNSALGAINERAPLHEFGYGDVVLDSELHNQQLQENISVLMGLSDDSLLKPLRAMSGQAAPGEELGGWYLYDPKFDGKTPGWPGFAPASTFGQWVSSLARAYAIKRDEKSREKVLRLNQLYAKTISGELYENK